MPAPFATLPLFALKPKPPKSHMSAPASPTTLPHHTRIKICGLTREDDVRDAVAAGADAIGFVMYAKSPRHVSPERAAQLARLLPPFVTPVLLFVNEKSEKIRAISAQVSSGIVQFHGDESPEECDAPDRTYLRAARVPMGPGAPGFDLLEYAQRFPRASGILLDAHVDGYGGGGLTFDWTAFNWSRLPPNVSSRLVLSGGLTPANVTDGVLQVRPWAVDVSSGVEQDGPDGKPVKGIKCADKMRRFVAAVREADAALNTQATQT
jgi:phosphoribosylanthranilate isomerase